MYFQFLKIYRGVTLIPLFCYFLPHRNTFCYTLALSALLLLPCQGRIKEGNCRTPSCRSTHCSVLPCCRFARADPVEEAYSCPVVPVSDSPSLGCSIRKLDDKRKPCSLTSVLSLLRMYVYLHLPKCANL